MRFLSKWLGGGKSAVRPAARVRLHCEQLETRLVPYSASSNAWPHPALITLSFAPDGTILGTNASGNITSNLFSTFNNHSGWTQAGWEKQILKAAAAWAQQTNINIALVSDNGTTFGQGSYQQGDPNMGDIRIGGYNMNNSTLALANQPPPVNNYSAAGDIVFNTGQSFNIGSTYDLFSVAMHEIGHSLGLNESNTSTAVMYGSYSNVKGGLTCDDVNGIQSIYSNGSARSLDVYGGTNNSFANAAELTSQLDPTALSALVSNLDIDSINGSNGSRTSTQVEYFTVTAPAATSGTFSVLVQSTGLSLLAPTVTVYAADQTTVLGSASGAGQYGATLNVTVNNVTAKQQFYIKVAGAETTALGSGAYALGLNFGSGAMPAVTLPNTQTANGNPISAGGSEAQEEPGTDGDNGGGETSPTPTAPSKPVGIIPAPPAQAVVITVTVPGKVPPTVHQVNVPAALVQLANGPTTPQGSDNLPGTSSGPQQTTILQTTPALQQKAAAASAAAGSMAQWDAARYAWFAELGQTGGLAADQLPALPGQGK
jgi:hypothetical protein